MGLSRYNGSANGYDAAYDIELGNGHLYIGGVITRTGNGADFSSMKYLDGVLVTIGTTSENIPSEYALYQNYPNPFNPSTTIKFDLPSNFPPSKGDRGMFVRLAIYDLLGREVAVIVNESLFPGSYEVTFSAPQLSSGVYFYQLTSGTFRDIKRMTMIK